MMTRVFALLAALLLVPTLHASGQGSPPARPVSAADWTKLLGFEAEPIGTLPGGWRSVGDGSVFADSQMVHGGRWSLRLELRADTPSRRETAVYTLIRLDVSADTLVLHGFLRTQDVTPSADLRVVYNGHVFYDPRGKANGTTGWTEYSVPFPVDPDDRTLAIVVNLGGTGTVWADDLRILVGDKPIWEAPARPKGEFDGGSGVSVTSFTPLQIANLSTVGKVWGFLKYHHPAITSGSRNWDYDLFRVLPAVLAAPNRNVANRAMLDWTVAIGPVAPCKHCARLDTTGMQLRPDLDWLADRTLLGADLSKQLQAIHANRLPETQFYVSMELSKGDSTPTTLFPHEPPYYEDAPSLDAGYRLLALYRFWNIVEYWSPNRDLVGEDWNEVLARSIPRVTLAKDYPLELHRTIAMLHDGHAGLWVPTPPFGLCKLPVDIRFVEDRAVVTGYLSPTGQDTGLRPGDIITTLDGAPVDSLVQSWGPYYSASNDAARLREAARAMTRGTCGELVVSIRRGEEEFELRPERAPIDRMREMNPHDLPGETFRLLSGEVAYLKLSSAEAASAAHYIDAAAGTKGLIIDIRNYPSSSSGDVLRPLGALLVDRPTPFVRLTKHDLSNPGAFHWWGEPIFITPAEPHYAGKVVILVDEASYSNAEYVAMGFRAAPNAIVVGSTTSGVDGNAGFFNLPGGLRSPISSHGVFYPDKRPTQRVGIVPDVIAKPTIAGIREGRDEVMEAAIRQIMGVNTSQATIDAMIGRKRAGEEP